MVSTTWKLKDSMAGYRSSAVEDDGGMLQDRHVTLCMGYANELMAIVELNSASWTHAGINEIKTMKKTGCATSVEDPTSNVNVQVTVTTNFKIK